MVVTMATRDGSRHVGGRRQNAMITLPRRSYIRAEADEVAGRRRRRLQRVVAVQSRRPQIVLPYGT